MPAIPLSKPARRTRKIQVFLTEHDYETLRIVAEKNGEPTGAVASRCLAHLALDLRSVMADEKASLTQENPGLSCG